MAVGTGMSERAGIVRTVDRHLEPVPEPEQGAFEDGEEPLRRPTWWRWVAVVVVVTMVVATPFAYALYVILR